MVTKAIERAQRQVEAQNFATRKHLLEYDDVMNKQREGVYSLRREVLEGTIHPDEDHQEEVLDTRGYLMSLAEGILDDLIEAYCDPETDLDEWDLEALKRELTRIFALDAADFQAADFAGKTSDEIRDALWARITEKYAEKEKILGPDIVRRVERDVMLQIVDVQWKDHLYSLDHLKEGIGLRGYAQRDPLIEYKKESFDLFRDMKGRIDEETVRYLWALRPVVSESPAAPRPVRRPGPMILNEPGEPVGALASAPRVVGGGPAGLPTRPPRPARTGGDDAPIQTVRRDEPKVGRNDPCPCGSGKKYKKCHGAAA
jgi:preprotein translocase subunit SecA